MSKLINNFMCPENIYKKRKKAQGDCEPFVVSKAKD